MSLVYVNKISGENRTFGDIAKGIFMIAIKSGNASYRIDMYIKTPQSRQQSVKIEEKLLV